MTAPTPDPIPLADKLSRVLYTSVVSDVLDGFGLMRQALRPFVRPLDETLVLFGRARTGRYEPLTAPSTRQNPYELEMELVDSLHHGDVAVLACGGPTEVIAPWGELLSTAARAAGRGLRDRWIDSRRRPHPRNAISDFSRGNWSIGHKEPG